MIAEDKAGKDFWDSCWQDIEIPEAVNPAAPGIRGTFYRRMDEFYRQVFSSSEQKNKTLIEIGCALSPWLPYFASEFGLKVSGLDYSEIGCQQEKHVLEREGVEGEIILADFFNPPQNILGTFDYVYSSGVAEHFIPTERCISAFAAFLKPGGKIITIIPNMTGAIGWLQKICNRPVFDIHVPITAEQLQKAHEKVGLKVMYSRYFLSTGFGIVNTNGLDQKLILTRGKKNLLRGLEGASALFWCIENIFFQFPATRVFSPFVICVAEKPE